MKKATIAFQVLAADVQRSSLSHHYILSRIFYDLKFNGKVFKNIHVNVKQSVNNGPKTDILELDAPFGYERPLACQDFRKEVMRYYFDLVGKSDISTNLPGARLRHFNIFSTKTCQIKIGDEEELDIVG
jgi:hypothetical protein